MTDSGTARYARNLDRVRRRRGPTGDLTFLRFTGAHEYTAALVVTAGWFAETKKRREQTANQGKPTYLSVEVVAMPGIDLRPLLHEEWRLAIGGCVYTMDKDYLDPPVASPFVWPLQAYRTDDTYPPA